MATPLEVSTRHGPHAKLFLACLCCRLSPHPMPSLSYFPRSLASLSTRPEGPSLGSCLLFSSPVSECTEEETGSEVKQPEQGCIAGNLTELGSEPGFPFFLTTLYSAAHLLVTFSWDLQCYALCYGYLWSCFLPVISQAVSSLRAGCVAFPDTGQSSEALPEQDRTSKYEITIPRAMEGGRLRENCRRKRWF